MTETARVGEACELAVLTRSGFVETRHAGSAVVLDGATGDTLESLGNPDALVFPRSAMKPFQAVAMLNSGVELTGQFAALATASHTGSALHVRLVQQLLNDNGLDESRLACPRDWPTDRDMLSELTRGFGEPHEHFMNCSGKHAAMLVTCAHNGWPIEGYLEPEHPLQKAILATVEDFIDVPVTESGIDGCGAPVHAMSLTALARGIRRLGRARSDSTVLSDRNAAILRDAVIAHPIVAGGAGEQDTELVEELKIFAKRGAEGVLVVTAHDGTTVALKILDGSMRATGLVAIALLEKHGALDAGEATRARERVGTVTLGGGKPVGELRATI